MKTLHPVDEETYARIGKAYLICSQYPDVFGDVTFKKFCSMFVDVLDDDEDEQDVRLKVVAPAMYRLLGAALERLNNYEPYGATTQAIRELLSGIDEEGNDE